MKTQPVFFFLALLTGLWIFAHFGDRPLTVPITSRQTDQQFLPFTVDEIDRLTFRIQAGEVTLQRIRQPAPQEDIWRVVQPIQDRANLPLIRKILKTLSNLRVRTTFGKNETGPQTEMETPAVRMIVKTQNKEEHSLELGTENPIDRSLLMRMGEDGKIYKVRSPNLRLSNRNINDFRDPFLTSRSSKSLLGLELHHRGKIRLKLQSPSLNPLEKALEGITNSRILDFVLDDKSTPDALKEYGLEKPKYVLNLQYQNLPPLQISVSDVLGARLGESENRVAVTTSLKNGVYLLDATLLEKLRSLEKTNPGKGKSS